jgi:hypothetical protein
MYGQGGIIRVGDGVWGLEEGYVDCRVGEGL